jgi:hypothetical protein
MPEKVGHVASPALGAPLELRGTPAAEAPNLPSFERSAAAVERDRVGAAGAQGGRRVGEGLGVRIVLTDLARPGETEPVRAPARSLRAPHSSAAKFSPR